MPSGTGAGKPFELDWFQKRFIYAVYAEHGPNRDRLVRRAILSIARKNGKALSLDTKLPTPNGWVTMGDIKQGDTLFDENGKPCKVTFVTPIQHNRNCYRVKFSDGAEITADADHQWTVYSRAKHGKKLTLTTADMVDDYILPYSRDGHNERNYSVDVAGAVECSDSQLPIAPYTFGVWLGDGSSAGARITCVERDKEIVEFIKADGYPVRRQRSKDRAATWSISDGVRNRTKDCVQARLRKLGVLRNKHIPMRYLRGSIKQRQELLCGLMDTDGSVSKAGQCEFVSVSEQLANDTIHLVRSLGMKASMKVDRAKLDGRDCGPRYRVQFWAYQDAPCFKLERKKERLKERPKRSRNSRNYITAIEPIDSVPVRCIQVDSPSSLFLAGEAFTPTHNTALIAALVLVHLVGPEAIQNGEIYSAANDREQAAQVFKVAAQIVRADPELNAMLRVVDSTKTIACLGNGSFYKALSAEAGTKHGLNPSAFIYDELAQSKNRELYDVLDTSQGARFEPLGIVISTQSNDPVHPLSELIDDGLNADDDTIVCHLYAVPDDCEDIFDPKVWKLANPALGTFRRLDDFQAMADRAKRLKSFENTFRNLYLNQRVSIMTTLFSKSDWMGRAGEVEFEENEEVILSLDFAGTTDLAALGMMSLTDARFKCWFWKPGDTIGEQEKNDRVPYRLWRDEGLLEVSHGRIIDPQDIAQKIGELAATYSVQGLVYDRWRIGYIQKELERQDLDAREADDADIVLMPWGQGFKDMSPAIEALENLVLSDQLRHENHPILNWNIANAIVQTDAAGNRKFDKEKSRMRIDGAQVLAMAAGKRAHLLDEHGPSIYEDRGALVI